jgi:hypothetical protein
VITPRFWYVYDERPPLDFWHWALPPAEHFRRLLEGGTSWAAVTVARGELNAGLLAIASRTEWDGSGVVRIGAVANLHEPRLEPMILITSDDGEVFLASRLQMPWADGYCGHSMPQLTEPLSLEVDWRLEVIDSEVAQLCESWQQQVD